MVSGINMEKSLAKLILGEIDRFLIGKIVISALLILVQVKSIEKIVYRHRLSTYTIPYYWPLGTYRKYG